MVLPLPSPSRIYDCIIVGAGPAGIAAATQLKRTDFQVLLIEKESPGGMLRNAQAVENYLGFLKISGGELCKKFQKHLQKWKIPLLKEEVLTIKKRRLFLVQTESKTYTSRTVIVATGTKPKKFPLKKLSTHLSKKIIYELGPLLRLKSKNRIGIVGGGDLAFDYALHLKERIHEPLIFARHKFTCLPLLLKRSTERKILRFESVKLKSVERQGQKLILHSTKGNFEVDYVLVAIGRKPQMPRISPPHPKGLYWAGDVHNGPFRQAVIAAGDGLKAAMKVVKNAHDHRKRNRQG